MKVHYKNNRRTTSKNIVHSFIRTRSMRFSDRSYITIDYMSHEFDFKNFCKEVKI